MLVFSLLLFAAALVVVAVSASRGLAEMDQILTVVGPEAAEGAPEAPRRADG